MCVLTRRSLAEDSSPGNIAKLAQRVVDRYELELVNHFEIEEQLLFPACGSLPIVSELLADHRAMEGLVEELRTAPIRSHCWNNFASYSPRISGGKSRIFSKWRNGPFHATRWMLSGERSISAPCEFACRAPRGLSLSPINAGKSADAADGSVRATT